MCICLLRKNEPYFNLHKVICSHLSLFNKCKSQYIVFYVLPLFFSIGLSLIYSATFEFFSEISVIISIIISVLFVILSILSGHDYSSVKDKQQEETAKLVTKQTINAIIFTTALCIFLLLYGLTMIVVNGISFNWVPFGGSIIKRIVSGIAYYIFTVILLNLFLIIKHMSKLIEFNMYVSKKGDNK